MDRQIRLEKLLEIWTAYVEFRTPQVSPSTVARDYVKFEKRILLMIKSQPDLDDARDIKGWLLDHFSRESTRRTLQQFNAACQWAFVNEQIVSNPFIGLGRYLTRGRQIDEGTYTAFEPDEKRAIITAFSETEPFYTPWVWFLFATGCRPEEARALRWRDVAANHAQILIREAMPVDTGIRQATKTYRSTRFPCNERMQLFLRSRRQELAPQFDDYLFPSLKGGAFDYKNFQSRHWKPLVERLVADGSVAFYMSEYHCRHTFITQMVRAGVAIADISYLCRVSIATINRCYVSASRVVTVPNF